MVRVALSADVWVIKVHLSIMGFTIVWWVKTDLQ